MATTIAALNALCLSHRRRSVCLAGRVSIRPPVCLSVCLPLLTRCPSAARGGEFIASRADAVGEAVLLLLVCCWCVVWLRWRLVEAAEAESKENRRAARPSSRSPAQLRAASSSPGRCEARERAISTATTRVNNTTLTHGQQVGQDRHTTVATPARRQGRARGALAARSRFRA